MRIELMLNDGTLVGQIESADLEAYMKDPALSDAFDVVLETALAKEDR